VQQTFSKERTPTVWRIIPSLEFLIKRWESMAEQHKFRDVKDAITNGVDNLKKWYRKVDNTLAAYFICLGTCSTLLTKSTCMVLISYEVLDPNVKDLYCRHRWESHQYTAGLRRLEDVFDDYYVPPQAPSATSTAPASVAAAVPLARYGSSFLLEAVQSFQSQEKTAVNPRDELKRYLNSPVESTDDVIAWWGVRVHYLSARRIFSDSWPLVEPDF
jgi:hypothetical protein